MNRTAFIVASVVAASWAGTASAQQVSLTLRDGRATLTTQNASVRQILAEWERLGQVRIVGADRLAATQPLTISLVDVPERQALDIILRGVPGFMAVDRAQPLADASRYDRLVLLARTTTPVPAQTTASAAGPAPSQPYAQTMDQMPQPVNADADAFEDANAEPPMPVAPVVSPYPSGANGGANANANAGPAVLNSGSATVGVQPPETQFDYANPQRYFDRMRAQQQLQQQQGGQQPGAAVATPVAPYPGSTLDAPPAATTPSAVPSATGTLARPGIAPTPTTPPQQQQFFNPYNLPPDQLQGNPTSTTTPAGSPVEPDRAKYANPYVPTPRPPQ
jgi:hypothetical protein